MLNISNLLRFPKREPKIPITSMSESYNVKEQIPFLVHKMSKLLIFQKEDRRFLKLVLSESHNVKEQRPLLVHKMSTLRKFP